MGLAPGTRVLTAGMNVEQYQRNPVLLYMHERGNVIGYVKDLKVEDGEVTGELMFDEASELSVRCKKQYEFGSLKMVSAGLDILETSEDPELLVQGQTRPTVTKSKLFEVSLVDVGSNDDAIVLQKDGKKITLGKDSECPLPMLNNNNQKQMEQKQYALQLGLPETATDAEITAKLSELNAAKQENERLQKETLTLASITAAVEKAVGEKRITPDKKDESSCKRIEQQSCNHGQNCFHSFCIIGLYLKFTLHAVLLLVESLILLGLLFAECKEFGRRHIAQFLVCGRLLG